MPIADPSARHPSTASPVLVVGEGHAPVVAVLRDEAKKKPDVSIPAPKGRESRTPRHFPLHNKSQARWPAPRSAMSSPCCSVRLWSLRNGCRHRRRKRRPAVRAPAAVPADAGCCLRPAGGRRTGKTVLAGERCRRPLSARRRELLRVSARRWHAYIVEHIIHDWEDEDSTRILQVVRRAIPDNGVVLLIEADLGQPNETPASKFADLNMLVLPGGRERTLDEYAALLESAGFRLERATPTSSSYLVIEGVEVVQDFL
jgi:hypothetical protein